MGDYDTTELPSNYVNEFQLLPRQNAKQEDLVAQRHRELRGLLPAEAEARFLERACSLETYGVDPFVALCTTAIERQRKHAEVSFSYWKLSAIEPLLSLFYRGMEELPRFPLTFLL